MPGCRLETVQNEFPNSVCIHGPVSHNWSNMDSVVRISMNTEHLEKQQTVLSAVGSCAGPIMRTNPQPTADVNTVFPPRPRAP